MKQLFLQTARETIPISKVIFGSTYLGSETPDSETYEFLDFYYQQGGRTIDTARVYGQLRPGEVSQSERVIGQWMLDRGVRDDITLITKGAHPPLEDFSHSRVTAEEIWRDITDSLACLQTERIDIYFLHRDDLQANLEEVMGVLNRAVKEGKVRAIGASNWTLDRMLEANRCAEQHGWEPFTIAEIQWSLAVCDAEGWGDDTLVFMTEDAYSGFQNAGIPVLAYAAQAKGIFPQYIKKGKEGLSPKAKRFLNEKNLRRAEAVRSLSEQSGMTPAQVALAYIVDNPLPAAAIIGCSSIAQLEDSLQTVQYTLSAEEIAALEA